MLVRKITKNVIYFEYCLTKPPNELNFIFNRIIFFITSVAMLFNSATVVVVSRENQFI